MRFLMKLCLVLSLAMGTALVAPPADAQSSERVPIQRLDRDVQQLLMRTLRRAGMGGSAEMSVMVSTSDCPSNCNSRVRSGKCYCDPNAEDGSCPTGTDSVTYGDGTAQCSVNPTTAAVVGGPLREPQRFQLR